MTAVTILGVMTLIMALFVHTAVLFRWGGALTEMVRRHEKEIDGIRDRQSEQTNVLMRATLTLERVEARLDHLEREVHHD